jgi:hypothetical protein
VRQSQYSVGVDIPDEDIAEVDRDPTTAELAC